MGGGLVKVLYISYDGALDPLGRAQVVPYLEGLAERGHRIHLLTFEKPGRWSDPDARRSMAARLEDAGIRWHPESYTKRPPVLATAWDLFRGVRRARRIVRSRSIQMVHARSYPSALIAHRLHASDGIPYVFDIRGLYPEERVDGGLWRKGGLLYRVAKTLESAFRRDAAAVVTLTEASVPVLEEGMAEAGSDAELVVIPTCVDLERFRPAPDPDGPFELAYFGSIGTWYLLDDMLRFAGAVLDAAGGGRLRFLTNDDPGEVRRRARAVGVPEDVLEMGSVPHEEVPRALASASATFFFIRVGPSAVGFHQTKLGESLALGLPVAANRGVGDTAAILEGEGVGVVVDAFDDEAMARAARELVALARSDGIRGRCRRVAEARYDLREGVERYDRLYRTKGGGGLNRDRPAGGDT